MPYVGLGSLFSRLVHNTQLSSNTLIDLNQKLQGIRRALNSVYYGVDSEAANCFPIGSYAKNTIVGPRSNVDLLFELPPEVYVQYMNSTENIQLQILHDVRDTLALTFPSTVYNSKRRSIEVSFPTFAISIFPVFKLENGFYGRPDSTGDGFWQTIDPVTERRQLVQSDTETGGKTVHLIRMAKAWKRMRNVEISSFVLELLAIQFMTTWGYNRNRSGAITDYNVYDFMLRDFFPFLLEQQGRNIWFSDTSEVLAIGTDWKDAAQTAAEIAQRATELGAEDRIDEAEQEWRKLFGTYLY